MESDEDDAPPRYHRPNGLCAHGGCANRIDHTVDTARVALLHELDHILLAGIDHMAGTPALCNLQPLWRHITHDDFLNPLDSGSREGEQADRAGAKNQQALL